MGVLRKSAAAIAAAMTFGLGAAQADPADPVELFGQVEQVYDAQISPDGANVALGCGPNGRRAVCIYGLDSGETPKFFEPPIGQRLTNFYWASDKHLIVSVDWWDTITTSEGRRDLRFDRSVSFNIETDKVSFLMNNAEEWTSNNFVKSVCDSRPDKIYVELGTRLYEVDLDSGFGRTKESTRRPISTYIQDSKSCEVIGRIVWMRDDSDFWVELDERDDPIIKFEGAISSPLSLRGPTNDGTGFVVFVDYEDKYGLYKLAADGSGLTPILMDGIHVQTPGVVRDRFTDTVIGFRFTDDLSWQYFSDPQFKSMHDKLVASLPDHTVRLISWTRDHSLITLVAERPGQPPVFLVYDDKAVSMSPLGGAMPHLAEVALGGVYQINYTARDGMEIPAYLTLPPGKTMADGPFSTILLPHGGPEARDTARFDWWSQAYASAGYAVLQPNFRGSSGYGAEFRDAGFGEFGGKMITDVLDGLSYLEAEGIARSDGACVAGASYGGYSALMVPLLGGERIKCSVAVNAVTDIYEHMGRFSKDSSVYDYWARYVGSDVFGDDAFKKSVTPAERANEYRLPVLLMYSEEDITVLPGQSERFIRTWGNRSGLDVVKMTDTDHYLGTTEARQTVLRESLDFLNTHLPVN